MKKIAIVLGTRPEAIKLLPVYIALRKNEKFTVNLVSTGQHREMLQLIFHFFEIVPDVDLGIMTHDQSLCSLTATLLVQLDQYFTVNPADLIVIQGDTATCMAASMVAYYKKIPVAHVEAGLRTGDIYSPFPEEINRKITGVIAHYHFSPTLRATKALEIENIKKGVYTVGNTVIDSLLYAKKKIDKNENYYEQKFKQVTDFSQKIILITGHRRESFGDGFSHICKAIRQLAFLYEEYQFIYPVHLNPNVKKVVYEKLSELANVKLIPPLPYDELIFLMGKSHLVLTDSGGIQEEAPSLNKPVVILREITERPEGLDAGCSVLAGTTCDKIVKIVSHLLGDKDAYLKMAMAENPYGSGDSANKISSILADLF